MLEIEARDVIGQFKSTGGSTRAYLHFEHFINNNYSTVKKQDAAKQSS